MVDREKLKLPLPHAGQTHLVHVAALNLAIAVSQQSAITPAAALEMASDFMTVYGAGAPLASRPSKLVDDVQGGGNETRTATSSEALPASQASEKARIDDIINKTVSDNHIKCLCCGKTFKTLRRHLNQIHGLTIPQYLEQFNLPDDYPTSSKNYSELRKSNMASLRERMGGNIARGRSKKPT